MSVKQFVAVVLSGWLCLMSIGLVQASDEQDAHQAALAFFKEYDRAPMESFDQLAARTRAGAYKEIWVKDRVNIKKTLVRRLRKATAMTEYGLDKHQGVFMRLEYDAILNMFGLKADQERRETVIMEREDNGKWRLVEYDHELDSDIFEQIGGAYRPDLPKDDYLTANSRVANAYDQAVKKYGAEDARLIRFLVLQAIGLVNQSKYVKTAEQKAYIDKAQTRLWEAYALWQKANPSNLIRGAGICQMIAQFYAGQKQADQAIDWQKKAAAILEVPDRNTYETKSYLQLKNILATWLFETGAKADARAVFESMVGLCAAEYGASSKECQPLQAAIDQLKG